MLYYDVDSAEELNQKNKLISDMIQNVWQRHSILHEILAYDEGADATSAEYAKVKPRQVIEAMVFSDPRFNIDVLKVSSNQ